MFQSPLPAPSCHGHYLEFSISLSRSLCRSSTTSAIYHLASDRKSGRQLCTLPASPPSRGPKHPNRSTGARYIEIEGEVGSGCRDDSSGNVYRNRSAYKWVPPLLHVESYRKFDGSMAGTIRRMLWQRTFPIKHCSRWLVRKSCRCEWKDGYRGWMWYN